VTDVQSGPATTIGIVCAAEDEALLRALLDGFEPIARPDRGFYLSFEEECLQLRQAGDTRGIWVSGEEIERRLAGQFLLGRACGLPAPGLHVLDATGGMGVDALALARKGARVDVAEREPMLWALLKDLIRRVGVAEVTAILADSAELMAGDARYDVIYLDPMFPARRKKALPGKRMQYLGALLADSGMESADGPFDVSLVQLARRHARSRVVLKRRLKDPAVIPPDWSLKGRSVRYDVFRGLA
jgi:16S rRNA (guanine1516-N2)-methyltransferase